MKQLLYSLLGLLGFTRFAKTNHNNTYESKTATEACDFVQRLEASQPSAHLLVDEPKFEDRAHQTVSTPKHHHSFNLATKPYKKNGSRELRQIPPVARINKGGKTATVLSHSGNTRVHRIVRCQGPGDGMVLLRRHRRSTPFLAFVQKAQIAAA